MSFDWLFGPVEDVDEWLTGLFDGAPLLVALLVAFVLGLRHASDPDHLVAVTSLVAADEADTRAAARLGAWWGVGHAATLLVIGVPLIAVQVRAARLAGDRRREGRGGGDRGAGRAGRVQVGPGRLPRRAPHQHAEPATHAPGRHLFRGDSTEHTHRHVRSPTAGVRDRHAARSRRHRRGRGAADRRAALAGRGGGGAGGVRADVDAVDGRCAPACSPGCSPGRHRAASTGPC